ncbi:LamB/YcsF family protein [Sodalis glossinidius str. 'morsitans']|nr:LamB/YcsF family protein [Sodalis glossinidius str. 'morsitans']
MLIDLNSYMGESFGVWTMGDDACILEIVSSANIACGFHAGDPEVMHNTLSLAHARGVGVGAHPGFYDLQGFGRRQILGDSPAQIERQIVYQIGAMQALAKSVGSPLRHVKTHGALGNLAAEDPALAQAVARAIASVDRDLIMVVMPGMETEKAALALGLPVRCCTIRIKRRRVFCACWSNRPSPRSAGGHCRRASTVFVSMATRRGRWRCARGLRNRASPSRRFRRPATNPCADAGAAIRPGSPARRVVPRRGPAVRRLLPHLPSASSPVR